MRMRVRIYIKEKRIEKKKLKKSEKGVRASTELVL